MILRPSTRKQAKIKLALQGCAGSGKTYSALLLAYGMTSDWSKIAVIGSENGSADLYAHLGTYNVVSLGGDYSPENYIEAITLCENAGMEVIIVDSISQGTTCWISMQDCKATPLQTGPRLHPGRMPLCRKSSNLRCISSVPCAPSRIMCSMKRTARWSRRKWVLKPCKGMAWTMNSPSSWI